MGFKMLIVDDSVSMRSIIKRTVQMSGFDVDMYFEAANGKEALELIEKEWVDIILTDVNMPVMDGGEFLEALQKNSLLSSVPAIVVTTEGREDRLEELKQLGAKAFVKKPFKPEYIRDTLMRVLGLDSLDTGDDQKSDDMDF